MHLRMEHLLIRYKLNGWLITALFYGEWVNQRCFQLVSGTEENDYILLVLCQNSLSDLAYANPWNSMLLPWNRFAMLTHITFLVFGLFIKLPLTLLTSWLLAWYAHSTPYNMASQMYGFATLVSRPSCSIVYLMKGIINDT